jgi:MGT family glycosyltransferase
VATYLICSTPIHGHVTPMTGIGEYLVDRDHRVIMLTGSRFEDRTRDAGMEFVPLTGIADFDDRDMASHLPDRARYRGLAQAQYDIQTIFIRPIPEQFRAVESILGRDAPDAVLVDSAFAGVLPLLLGSRATRPRILAAGVTPLSQASRDVAPYGMALPPRRGAVGRLRNGALNCVARRVLFRETQRAAQRALAQVGSPPLTQFAMDISSLFDRFLQLNTTEFEYPRSDLSPNASFVGPLPSHSLKLPLPPWWGDLDGTRPVVHVTQGTADNRDLGRLIRPTIEAMAGADALVVVSLGGGPASGLGAVPNNVRVADYLPYDRLLPLTDVFVSNGGFGGVQSALRYGVPIAVAGDTEDKPEVAARVAWGGTGINLGTGSPSSAELGAAIRTLLSDDSFRDRARAQAESIATCTPLESIEQALAAAAAFDGL